MHPTGQPDGCPYAASRGNGSRQASCQHGLAPADIGSPVPTSRCRPTFTREQRDVRVIADTVEVAAQLHDENPRQRHHPDAVILRSRNLEPPLPLEQAPSYERHTFDEVDVRATQRDQLTATKTCQGRGEHERAPRGVGSKPQDLSGRRGSPTSGHRLGSGPAPGGSTRSTGSTPRTAGYARQNQSPLTTAMTSAPRAC